jgi:hypothetical protein
MLCVFGGGDRHLAIYFSQGNSGKEVALTKNNGLISASLEY